ncbi:hypothetical protein F4809DRAFT_61554 [Biscogniauxia mediterranea]|nr:hypothetical protein F4809DRAFT_61554 [Biscogniauxia mediterranea]
MFTIRNAWILAHKRLEYQIPTGNITQLASQGTFGIIKAQGFISRVQGSIHLSFTQISTMGSLSTHSNGHGQQGPFNVKRIAIVGAGPCGVSAAKYLLAEEAFERIDIYEQAAEVGGVWNYSPLVPGTVPVPQTDAFAPAEEPVYPETGASNGKGKTAPVFPSPMYDDLHTNIPHTLMQYSDLDFPAGCEIYPSREVVQEYLVEYAKDVRHLIKFSTQVEDIALRTIPVAGANASENRTQDQWDVRAKDLLSGETSLQTYDAVVVASGHYTTPYIPDSDPGSHSMVDIRAFNEAHPGVIIHSKLYRNPEPYRGKKVVVVGTGPSGLDIAAQIRPVCKGPLLVSAKTGSPPEALAHLGAGVEQVGEIARFLPGDRGVVFRAPDGGGHEEGERVETGVDVVLFCTGYLYTFPFLATADPPLVTDGRRVRGLAKHFIHIAHPTLAFPGLPMKIIPFPLSEAQAAVFARLWSNALPLPPREVLEAWEREAGPGDGKEYHVFPKGTDGKYINELHDWAMQARRGGGDDGDGRSRKGRGKEPPVWGEELLWQREIFAEAKVQFEKTGRKAKTLEELGFVRKREGLVESADDVKNKGPQIDIAG